MAAILLKTQQLISKKENVRSCFHGVVENLSDGEEETYVNGWEDGMGV